MNSLPNAIPCNPNIEQLRVGTAAEHKTYIGANGEVTVSTDDRTLRMHDCVTPGGHTVGGGGGGGGGAPLVMEICGAGLIAVGTGPNAFSPIGFGADLTMLIGKVGTVYYLDIASTGGYETAGTGDGTTFALFCNVQQGGIQASAQDGNDAFPVGQNGAYLRALFGPYTITDQEGAEGTLIVPQLALPDGLTIGIGRLAIIVPVA